MQLPGFGANNTSFLNRKLSKREKKEKKKRDKKEKAAAKAAAANGKDSLAERLYSEMPETSFTRSISNPEAVMRRRRQQKLEKKLQQFSQEGGPEAGGTLRIFGESINQDVPYKTILLSTRDTASFAVKEILEKYGKEKEDPNQYCLVQMIVPYVNGEMGGGGQGHAKSASLLADNNMREYILDEDDCPLIIERSHIKSRGVLTFHIRRRPHDYQPRKRKKKPYESSAVDESVAASPATSAAASAKTMMLPFLIEVNPDGSDISPPVRAGAQQGNGQLPRRHYLYMNVTEVGSEVSNDSANNNTSAGPNKGPPKRNSLQLFGPNVQPRHCVIAHTEGIITVTPCSRESETFVNGTRIYETTILKHGMLVRFGKLHTFKFVDEASMRRHSQLSTGPMVGLHFQQQQQHRGSHATQASTATLDRSGSLTTIPYETTFDADGKVETQIAQHSPAAGAATSGGKSSVDPRGSPFHHSATGSLQRHHTVNSLPLENVGNESVNVPPPPVARLISQQPVPNNTNQVARKGDNILPAILEVWEEIEDPFLNIIIKRIDPNQVPFKLGIAYTLYMVTRYRASTYFKQEINPDSRANLLVTFCLKYSNMIYQTIGEHHNEQAWLAFWLGNSSELLNFLKNDRHLNPFLFESREVLEKSVQLAFDCLVACQHHELKDALATFGEDITDPTEERMAQMTGKMLTVLSNSMQLLQGFRVNAALTIQLFSQLFHFINMWIFNKVIGTPQVNYCTRPYGLRIRNCIVQVELWAEKHGLELAAECHLSRIVQTAQFLISLKSSPEELKQIVANFYKLNSLQLRALFDRYQSSPEDGPATGFTNDQVESVIKMARNTTDELLLKEGRELRLEEEPDLQLPFLLPEDGYSCDVVRGIPVNLQNFVQTLVQARVCNLTIQPTASGYWTIYFIDFQPESVQPMMPDFMQAQADEQQQHQQQQLAESSKNGAPNGPSSQFAVPSSAQIPAKMPGQYNTLRPGGSEPEVQILKLQKSNNGMGLSIVGAKGSNQTKFGIYIKSVVKGGAADQDGRLEAGDQLLKVDGNSLIGISQERAAELMTQTGPIVTLEVAKQGALYHGLSGILAQQSQSTSNVAQAGSANSMVYQSPLNMQQSKSEYFNVEPFHGITVFSYPFKAWEHCRDREICVS